MEGKTRLVVDTNILFAALINPQGKTAQIIIGGYAELYAPDYLLHELEKYKEFLIRKGDYTDAVALEEAVEYLIEEIRIIPFQLYKDEMNHALQITPDPKDSPFVALALKLGAPLWTNDKELKKVKEITVLETKDVIKTINMEEG